MDLQLKNKIALVTGGSKGIGAAIAKELAREGCTVIIAARGKEALEKTKAEIIAAGGVCHSYEIDFLQNEQIEGLCSWISTHFPQLSILVNNVGGVSRFVPFEEISDQDWLQMFQLNLFATVRITRALIPMMKARKEGRIINISSESGTQPDPLIQHYNAAKAALNNFTKSLSKAYIHDGILINAVSPAFILTAEIMQLVFEEAEKKKQTYQEVIEEFLDKNRPNMGLKRPGQPEEVASVVAFLASEKASFITGANLRIDGGSVATV